MNYIRYQNFPNRSVNIEVPLVTDPRTNVLQTLYSQSNDEIWIETWLQQNCIYRPLPKVKINKSKYLHYLFVNKYLKFILSFAQGDKCYKFRDC